MENKAGVCQGMHDYFVLLTFVPSFVSISVYFGLFGSVCLFELLVHDIFSSFYFHFYFIIVIININYFIIMFLSRTIHKQSC